jgi:CAF1 family ribonuclease
VAVSHKICFALDSRPCSRDAVLAVSFLLKNKFRFDLPFSEGISYLSRGEEAQIRASWAARDAERVAFEDMVLKVDDKPLVDHIHLSVQRWLSQSPIEREDSLNIPHTTQEKPRIKHIPTALNRYQMRITHQTIRKEYPHLKTVGRDGFVRITIRNEKEDAEQKLQQDRYREQDVIQAIEFRWLVEALCGGDISKIPERCFLSALSGDTKPSLDDDRYSNYVDDLQHRLSTRRRILIGHNCFTDLVYLYACFIGDPPDNVEDFQEQIHQHFPAVVDTKFLASMVKELKYNSNLEALEKEMRAESLPAIEVPTAFDRYVWGEHFHEAGFDSFMTAKVAIKLSAKLDRAAKLRETTKPQVIVKSGETILMNGMIDTEDEELMDEYVTAPESSVETESVMSTLAAKLLAVLSAPAEPKKAISQPFDGQRVSGAGTLVTGNDPPDEQDAKIARLELKPVEQEPAQQLCGDSTIHNEKTTSEISATGASVVAVKEKAVSWRSPNEIKRIKNALVHNNLFDVLDTPVGPVTERIASDGHTAITKSSAIENEQAEDPGADLLIWSDREDRNEDEDEDEDDDASSQGVALPAETSKKPLTAQELEEKIKVMAAKGEMMPRWESESGIWKTMGNKLLVNACEEGVCIL